MKKAAKTNRKGGFTIMETIVAFTLLTMSLAGFSGMIVSSIRAFRNSEEKYVAAKIAQEGMELATNKKDNHVQCVAADPTCSLPTWQSGLVGNWQVEAWRNNQLLPNGTFTPYNASNKICIISSGTPKTGTFGYCGSTTENLSPQYSRQVLITSISANIINVKSIVRWNGGKSLTLEANLFSR